MTTTHNLDIKSVPTHYSAKIKKIWDDMYDFYGEVKGARVILECDPDSSLRLVMVTIPVSSFTPEQRKENLFTFPPDDFFWVCGHRCRPDLDEDYGKQLDILQQFFPKMVVVLGPNDQDDEVVCVAKGFKLFQQRKHLKMYSWEKP